MKVAPERTNWRDEGLSARHRTWGWDCPAVDIDFLMLEYDHGEPRALIEYKNERATPQKASHPSYRALISLGDRADVPFYCVRYASDYSLWKIIPLNKRAKEITPNRIELDEQAYISFLHSIKVYRK